MNLGLKLHWKALWVCVLAICHCRLSSRKGHHWQLAGNNYAATGRG